MPLLVCKSYGTCTYTYMYLVYGTDFLLIVNFRFLTLHSWKIFYWNTEKIMWMQAGNVDGSFINFLYIKQNVNVHISCTTFYKFDLDWFINCLLLINIVKYNILILKLNCNHIFTQFSTCTTYQFFVFCCILVIWVK